MKTYFVNYTNKNKTRIEIDEEAIDTSTDMVLFGRKHLQYGQDLNQNLLYLLEKFACRAKTIIPCDSNPDPETGYVIPYEPDTSSLCGSDGKLVNPVNGQLWYNSSHQVLFFWSSDDSQWIAISNGDDIAANWGVIYDGNRLPQPVDTDGNAIPYANCVWIVGPFTYPDSLEFMQVDADVDGYVTSTYTPISGVLTPWFANYLIIGIKGNVNSGTISPVATITPTPTITPSPTPSATVTVTATLTPTPTRTVTPSPTDAAPPVTRTPTPTPTPSVTRTVSNTPVVTPSATNTRTPTPTRTVTPTNTTTPTVTPSVTPSITLSPTTTLTPTVTRTSTPTVTPTNTTTPTPTVTPSV